MKYNRKKTMKVMPWIFGLVSPSVHRLISWFTQREKLQFDHSPAIPASPFHLLSLESCRNSFPYAWFMHYLNVIGKCHYSLYLCLRDPRFWMLLWLLLLLEILSSLISWDRGTLRSPQNHCHPHPRCWCTPPIRPPLVGRNGSIDEIDFSFWIWYSRCRLDLERGEFITVR